MTEFIIAFVIVSLAVAGMAIGVLMGRRPISGSCGGLNNIPGLECGICSTPCEKKRRALGTNTD